MNSEDPLKAWLAHRRETKPPERLIDRIMQGVTASSEHSMPVRSPPSQRGRRRLMPYLLATAAVMVCGLRIYSVLDLVLAPVVMDADELELRSLADEQRVACRTRVLHRS